MCETSSKLIIIKTPERLQQVNTSWVYVPENYSMSQSFATFTKKGRTSSENREHQKKMLREVQISNKGSSNIKPNQHYNWRL